MAEYHKGESLSIGAAWWLVGGIRRWHWEGWVGVGWEEPDWSNNIPQSFHPYKDNRVSSDDLA